MVVDGGYGAAEACVPGVEMLVAVDGERAFLGDAGAVMPLVPSASSLQTVPVQRPQRKKVLSSAQTPRRSTGTPWRSVKSTQQPVSPTAWKRRSSVPVGGGEERFDMFTGFAQFAVGEHARRAGILRIEAVTGERTGPGGEDSRAPRRGGIACCGNDAIGVVHLDMPPGIVSILAVLAWSRPALLFVSISLQARNTSK